MSDSFMHVLRAGLQTTVQDLGRWGYQSQGIPVAGPMDVFSHRLANALVGNDRNAAALEITLAGPELEFEDERLVAVTGAEFSLTVDGQAAPHAEAFMVSPHARLCFGDRTRGARAYLAARGGFDVPLLFGSRATHVPSGMGGWLGRALARGDRLRLGHASARRHAKTIQRRVRTDDPAIQSPVVRVLAGPDRGRFAANAFDLLQSAPYVVDPDSDRMGFRLNGPSIPCLRAVDMISDATPIGSLQVTGAGQLVLLMADRQTTGGYPRIATAISADIPRAAQVPPGGSLSLKLCPPEEALSALVASEQQLQAVEALAS